MVFVQNTYFLFQTVPHFNIDFQSYMQQVGPWIFDEMLIKCCKSRMWIKYYIQQVGPRSIISKNYKYMLFFYTHWASPKNDNDSDNADNDSLSLDCDN